MTPNARTIYGDALRNHWPAYGAGFAAMLLTSLTEVFAPKCVQWALDTMAPSAAGQVEIPALLRSETPQATLEAIVIALGCVMLLGFLGRMGWRQALARRTHNSGRLLKTELWQVLRYVPLRTFHRYPLGDLMNRATGDWNSGRFILGFTLVLTFDVVFFCVLALGAMLLIDVELTLYCLVAFLFLPRLLARFAKREGEQHKRAQQQLSGLADSISQALSTLRLQRATASDVYWQRRLDGQASAYAGAKLEVLKTGLKMFPLGAVPTLVAYGILLLIGLPKVTTGELSVGEFVALSSYALLLQTPMFELGDCVAEWQEGLASLDRIAEVLRLDKVAMRERNRAALPEPADEAASGPQPLEHARIAFDELSFSYDATTVLSRISLGIERGAVVGVRGPVGSGKSTLLSLIAGLESDYKGQLELAGTDVRSISRQWLAEHVALVPQKSFLFAGSVRANLELDQPRGDEALWRVLRLVALDVDVRRFSNGLDTWIGEWGLTLSGGQRQRLALARALLRARDIVLLDDCLSAVDAATEARILDNLNTALEGLTVVWVAHRQSTLSRCDRVYELNQGILSEQARQPAKPKEHAGE